MPLVPYKHILLSRARGDRISIKLKLIEDFFQRRISGNNFLFGRLKSLGFQKLKVGYLLQAIPLRQAVGIPLQNINNIDLYLVRLGICGIKALHQFQGCLSQAGFLIFHFEVDLEILGHSKRNGHNQFYP